MKNIICLIVMLLLSINMVLASDYNYKPKDVYYNLQTASWSDKKQSDNDIALKFKNFVGSGGFNEYYYDNGKLAIGPCTNVEFIADGKLIGINGHDLKFVKYNYNNGRISSEYLTEQELKKLYPEYEIVKISQFKNNEITINKKIFTKKRVLLLNDTKESFYKYSYKPAGVNRSGIKPFINLSHSGKIVFSHYGVDTELFPALKIHVKNKFRI